MIASRGGVASLALVAALAVSAPARALADDDPWLAGDKAVHFAVSGAIASGGYAVGAALFDARGHALLFGGALTITVGAAKELADLAGAGTPSWKDFAWDGFGTLAGLAIAWGVDLMVRGVSDRHPLFVVPRGGAPAVGFVF